MKRILILLITLAISQTAMGLEEWKEQQACAEKCRRYTPWFNKSQYTNCLNNCPQKQCDNTCNKNENCNCYERFTSPRNKCIDKCILEARGDSHNFDACASKC